MQPPPSARGAHASNLANSRWHPTREQLRELMHRVDRAHMEHADDLTSTRRILSKLDGKEIWHHERPRPEGATATRTSRARSQRSCTQSVSVSILQADAVVAFLPVCAVELATEPYVLIVQAEWQRELMVSLQSHGAGMLLHLDATGKTNLYNSPLFAFLYKVRTYLRPTDSHGYSR